MANHLQGLEGFLISSTLRIVAEGMPAPRKVSQVTGWVQSSHLSQSGACHTSGWTSGASRRPASENFSIS